MVKITTKMLNSLISKYEKNEFLDVVKSSIKDRLSEEIESNKIFEPIVQILNTEGWEYKKIGHSGNTISDFEFTDTKEEHLYEQFNIPLAAAGVKISSVDLLNQWHDLLQYSKEFLSTGLTNYIKTWQKINSSPQCCGWKNILTLIELLFTIPVSNAKIQCVL